MRTAELKAEIVRNGITQEQLSAIVGISVSTMSQKVNGIKDWNVAEIKLIKQALNLSPEKIEMIFFD